MGQRDLIDRVTSGNTVKKSNLNASEDVPNRNNASGDGSMNTGVSLARSILAYDPNVAAPRRGELSMEIENSKLNFFQMSK